MFNKMVIPTGNGGGSINPTLVDKGTGNTDYRNHAYSVTSGKTYLLVFICQLNTTDTTVSGGDILFEDYSNTTPWGSTNMLSHTVIVKSTSSTLTFNNADGPIYSPVLVQLD